MADVLISYASDDARQAYELGSLMRAKGLSVWDDSQLQAGESFADVLQKELEQAKAIVTLWSEEGVRSEWTLKEAAFALKMEKYIGIFLPGFDPSASGVRIRQLIGSQEHLYWPIDSSGEVVLDNLLSALKALGVEPSATNAGQIATPQSKGFAFISHVEEDIPIVSRISEFLQTRRYAYWSYHESERDYQKPTVMEIEERLFECALMLTVISPDWKRSEWTQRELAFAREVKKPLFHLRFRNPGPTLAIAGDTYFDFERGEDDAFRRLGLELDKKGL